MVRVAGLDCTALSGRSTLEGAGRPAVGACRWGEKVVRRYQRWGRPGSGTRYLHPAACRQVRVVTRVRGRAVVYRGRGPVLLVMLALVAAAFATGLLTGRVLAGAGAVVALLVAW